MWATIFLLCQGLGQKYLSLSPYCQETISFLLMGPSFNRGRAVGEKKKKYKIRKCIRLCFKITIPSMGYYYQSIKSSAEVRGPEYIQAATCLSASLPPPPSPICLSSFLPPFLNFYFPSSFPSFWSVIFILSSLEPVTRTGEYIVCFAIIPSARRNTSMSAKCPCVPGESFEGLPGEAQQCLLTLQMQFGSLPSDLS